MRSASAPSPGTRTPAGTRELAQRRPLGSSTPVRTGRRGSPCRSRRTRAPVRTGCTRRRTSCRPATDRTLMEGRGEATCRLPGSSSPRGKSNTGEPSCCRHRCTCIPASTCPSVLLLRGRHSTWRADKGSTATSWPVRHDRRTCQQGTGVGMSRAPRLRTSSHAHTVKVLTRLRRRSSCPGRTAHSRSPHGRSHMCRQRTGLVLPRPLQLQCQVGRGPHTP